MVVVNYQAMQELITKAESGCEEAKTELLEICINADTCSVDYRSRA